MDFTSTILLVLLVILVICYYLKNRNLPPGPIGLPILGYLPFLSGKSHEVFMSMKNKYGSVMSLYLGTNLTIILNDDQVVQEAYLKQADIFSGRPNLFLFRWYQEDGGLIFNDNNVWKEQIRFALSTLKQFGFGKASLEHRILEEVNELTKAIKSYNGQPFSINTLLEQSFSNIMMVMVHGKRFDYYDPTMMTLLNNMHEVFLHFSQTNCINYIPALRHVLPGFKRFKKAVLSIRKFMNTIIDEHIDTYDLNNMRDYIDFYLRQMKKEEKNGKENTTFTRKQLAWSLENFLNAGTETSSTTFLWGLLHLVLNIHIQEKLHKEIDTILCSKELSTVLKAEMPYTEAFIMETHRIATILPLSTARRVRYNTSLGGFEIPQNTTVIANVWALHYDQQYWPKPEVFEPLRFLDNNGQLRKNIKSFYPFSLGKRACPGEVLAKTELFLFLTGILQKFKFELPDKYLKPDPKDYILGQTITPPAFKICAIER